MFCSPLYYIAAYAGLLDHVLLFELAEQIIKTTDAYQGIQSDELPDAMRTTAASESAIKMTILGPNGSSM